MSHLEDIDRSAISADLDAQGWAVVPKLLSATECDAVASLYQEDEGFRLYQDLYGEHVFPLQLTILLSEPAEDFGGGEFVLTEQRPRMQSRAAVVPLKKGDAGVFAVNSRPVQGTRGFYRCNLRYGVSKLHLGNRHTLGIMFHDAA